MSESAPPKVFISYSWSSPGHEAWVLQLAEELAGFQIHPVMDKYDLREGEDASHFMERLVNDPEIKKVILVCDRVYKEKADARRSGAGYEAQIVSAELYGHNDRNTKFVAVLAEKDEHGQGYVPTYYKGRIYIDLTDEAQRTERIDQLTRWIFDKPLHQRPTLGPRPSFLDETPALQLHTAARSRAAIDAMRTHKPFWAGPLREYLDTLAGSLEQLRLADAPNFEDLVLESIDKFRPYRDEFLNVIRACASSDPGPEAPQLVHRFFESALPYLVMPPGNRGYTNWEFDNFAFILYELFLLTVATLLKAEKFNFAKELTQKDYYGATVGYNPHDVMHPFTRLHPTELGSLDALNQKLPQKWRSYRAHLITQRITGSGLELLDVIQADILLFITTEAREDTRHRWFPHTIFYIPHHQGALPVFARSQSRQYYANLQPVIGISPTTLQGFADEYDKDGGFFRGVMFGSSVSIRRLIGRDKLCDRP